MDMGLMGHGEAEQHRHFRGRKEARERLYEEMMVVKLAN